jgi:hypothetical protein
MNTVARAVADLNTRLGLTGDDLEVVAKQFLDAADMLGGDVSASIAGVSRALNDWGVSAKDTSAVMDKLFVLPKKAGSLSKALAGKSQRMGHLCASWDLGLTKLRQCWRILSGPALMRSRFWGPSELPLRIWQKVG